MADSRLIAAAQRVHRRLDLSEVVPVTRALLRQIAQETRTNECVPLEVHGRLVPHDERNRVCTQQCSHSQITQALGAHPHCNGQ